MGRRRKLKKKGFAAAALTPPAEWDYVWGRCPIPSAENKRQFEIGYAKHRDLLLARWRAYMPGSLPRAEYVVGNVPWPKPLYPVPADEVPEMFLGEIFPCEMRHDFWGVNEFEHLQQLKLLSRDEIRLGKRRLKLHSGSFQYRWITNVGEVKSVPETVEVW